MKKNFFDDMDITELKKFKDNIIKKKIHFLDEDLYNILSINDEENLKKLLIKQ